MNRSADEYVLIVDDQHLVRELLASQLHYLGLAHRTAAGGEEALRQVREFPQVTLVLADLHMPGLSGFDLLRRLKDLDDTIQVVMISGVREMDTVRECLRRGAHDYLTKPFKLGDLAQIAQRAIDHCRLLRENERYRLHLEEMVLEKTREVRETRDIALLTLAKLAESRDNETGHHLERISAFTLRLGQELQKGPYGSFLADDDLRQLERSSSLHDIGKVGIPDSVLLKPEALTKEESLIMQTHTTIGGDTLRTTIERNDNHRFLVMAMEIAYCHHEKWNGSGYPAGLRGEEIPMSARIVALADAYDAITSIRPYKVAHDHSEAVRRIQADRGRHFDPVIVDAFLECETDFAGIRAGTQCRTPTPLEVGALLQAGAR